MLVGLFSSFHAQGCALLENAEKEKIMGDLRIIEENSPPGLRE